MDVTDANNNGTPLSGSVPTAGSVGSISITPLVMSPTPSSPSVQPKKKSIDDFVIGSVLGEGSYGAVVLGTDKETGVQYAIKILEKKHIIKENKIKYVQIEKEIFCKCNHPNIVKLFFTFRSETCLYYVLELCSQGDLLHQLKKVGSFDYESTKYYTAEIISALEHLHSLGIVHRDLKPENILMSADMHIKITDFGTGKIIDLKQQQAQLQQLSSLSLAESSSNNSSPSNSSINLHAQVEHANSTNTEPESNSTPVNSTQNTQSKARANSFVGTAEYVSPELISNKETSTDSDLWALGCIIYQLTTGRLPFRGKTEFLTFQKVSNRELVYPTNINPVIKDLIERLLVTKPTDRLGSSSQPGGFENLKKHEFFEGIDWESLPKMPPPTIRTPKEKIIFEDDPNTSTGNLASSSSSPLTHSGSSLSAMSAPHQSPALNSSANSIQIQSNSSNNFLQVKQTSSSGNLTISINPALAEKLNKFLAPGETIVEHSLVWKRKGFSIKKRHLVLISPPRLIYIDPKKMEVRGEIQISSQMKAELKNNNNFIIQTPKRKYSLEDIDHNPQKWVDAITNIVNTFK